MMRLLQRTIAATVVMAALLAGCSAGPVGDTLPNALGGLPQGAPARPNVVNRQYPAVHDMPAARPTEPLERNRPGQAGKGLAGGPRPPGGAGRQGCGASPAAGRRQTRG